jgi:hypothetical protein
MQLSRLLTVLGTCILASARPAAEDLQTEPVSTGLDKGTSYQHYADNKDVKDEPPIKKFDYNAYVDKRDAKDEELNKRFYYHHYVDKKDVGDEKLSKRFYYTNYVEKRDTSAED